jgi:uncharacterized protein YukE
MHIKEIKKEFAKTLNYLLGNEKFEGETKVYQPEEISISERVVGGKVELVNADGTLSPMPDGNAELADGFKFTVKDGLIESIEGEAPIQEQPAAMADVPAPTDAQTSENSAIEEMKKVTEELRADIESMKIALDDLKASMSDTANKDAVANFNKQISDLNDTIKKIANVPAEFSKTTKSNIAKDANDEGKKKLSAIFNSIK